MVAQKDAFRLTPGRRAERMRTMIRVMTAATMPIKAAYAKRLMSSEGMI